MRESVRKFAINLFILDLALTAAGYGLFYLLLPGAYFPLFPLVPFFLFTVTILVHIYLVRANENDARKFTGKYLGAMGLKIFIYIVFIAVFLILASQYAVPFLVSFLVCYVAFTLVEVIAILKYLKRP
jgi:hypothetical protein